MIIVVARLMAQPGKRGAFIKASQPSQAATREEDGNICYELYTSTEHPDELIYFEKWATYEALEAHRIAPHFLSFIKYRTENNLVVDGSKTVQIFEVEK